MEKKHKQTISELEANTQEKVHELSNCIDTLTEEKIKYKNESALLSVLFRAITFELEQTGRIQECTTRREAATRRPARGRKKAQ